MIRDTKDNYGIVSKHLHWISAVMIVTLFLLGENTELSARLGGDATVFIIHAWLGLIFIPLLVFRIFWHISNSSPSASQSLGRAGVVIYTLVKYVFYALMLIAVISGFSWMISIDTYREAVFSFNTDIPPASSINYDIVEIAHELHESSTSIVIILAFGHSVVAFYHHFVKKDNVLRRMWYGKNQQ